MRCIRKLYEIGWEQTTKDEDEMEYNQRVVLALELLLGLQTAIAGNYRLNPWSCSPEVANSSIHHHRLSSFSLYN